MNLDDSFDPDEGNRGDRVRAFERAAEKRRKEQDKARKQAHLVRTRILKESRDRELSKSIDALPHPLESLSQEPSQNPDTPVQQRGAQARNEQDQRNLQNKRDIAVANNLSTVAILLNIFTEKFLHDSNAPTDSDSIASNGRSSSVPRATRPLKNDQTFLEFEALVAQQTLVRSRRSSHFADGGVLGIGQVEVPNPCETGSYESASSQSPTSEARQKTQQPSTLSRPREPLRVADTTASISSTTRGSSDDLASARKYGDFGEF